MDPNPKLTVAQQTTRMLRAPMGLEHSQIAAAVVAPCTHDGQCPLRKGFWCSFSQNVHSGKIKKGNEEKFSYVVLRKIAVGHAALSFTKDIEGVWTNLSARSPMENSPSPLSVLREAGNIPRKDVAAFLHNVDWETYAPPLHRDEWGRILRSPIKKKAHIIMDVCQPDATVSRSTLTRSSVPKVPALYTALRKINWGGLYPALGNSEGGLSSRISSFSKMQEHDQFIPVDKDMMDTNQLVSSRGTSGGRKGGRNSNSNKTNAPASEMAFVANDKASRSVIKQDMGSMNSRIAMKAAAKLFGSINMNDDHGKKQSIGSNDDSAAAAVVSGGGRRRARAIQGQALSAHARRLGRTKRSRSAADDGEEAAEGK